jgi:hypothetical protein
MLLLLVNRIAVALYYKPKKRGNLWENILWGRE